MAIRILAPRNQWRTCCDCGWESDHIWAGDAQRAFDAHWREHNRRRETFDMYLPRRFPRTSMWAAIEEWIIFGPLFRDR